MLEGNLKNIINKQITLTLYYKGNSTEHAVSYTGKTAGESSDTIGDLLLEKIVRTVIHR